MREVYGKSVDCSSFKTCRDSVIPNYAYIAVCCYVHTFTPVLVLLTLSCCGTWADRAKLPI